MEILLIKLGAIGDVLRTTSVLAALNKKYPDCSVSWVTKKESFDILKNNELISKIYLIDENLAEKLKGKEFDLLISLDDEDNACSLASSLKTKKLVGSYMQNGKRVYTDDSASWFDMSLISGFGKRKADELKALNAKSYQEHLFNMLGLENHISYEPMLSLQNEDVKFAKKFSGRHGISRKDTVIGINTGAGGRWQDKRLSEEKTALLIDRLNEGIKNAKILLFGGHNEISRNEKIKSLVKTKIIDSGCGNSLMEFSSLVNLCRVIVTSDSLALHVAVALKKKVVCFFGPTPQSEIELYLRGRKIAPEYSCMCCYKNECNPKPDYSIDEMADAVKGFV